MTLPASLRLTVPLILLGFAAILSTVNVLYHVPRAEQAAVDGVYKRVVQELSRLQSTLEYLLLKGDLEGAQREIAVLAHNHDYVYVALADDQREVIAATRRAWLGRHIMNVLPRFDPDQASLAIRERRANLSVDSKDDALLGYAGILLGREQTALNPSRTGSLFLAYDLNRPKAEARAQVTQQSLYWAGWVTALALAMWLVFHFLLTRRTAQLMRAAEQLAAGNLAARSALKGNDELARLSRAFDAMAHNIADTQRRLEADIAERQRAEAALRVSETSYRAIFDAVEDAIFVLDVDKARIVDLNPKAGVAYGYTRDEMRELDMAALTSGEEPYTRENAAALIKRAIAGEQLQFEWHLKHKDGSLRWNEVFVKRVTIGGHVRILALARDITDKKRAAEELVQQRETFYRREKLAALGTLLAGVAHELNNPLSVVVARAIMLEEQSDAKTLGAAQKIRAAADRCARIVRTFLAMARQQAPERGSVDVNDVIWAALDIAGFTLRAANIELALDLQKNLPSLYADADQLHQVLLNLVINAQQALQDHDGKRRIRVTSRLDGAANVIRIGVADNGPGIPEHERARVFEPFFTTKPVGIGTGIGLAVSLGIVEAHGGTLTVDCPKEGGTVFCMTLPVGTGVASSVDAEPARAASGGSRAILVVDDEVEIRDTLADILTQAGHRVRSVGSARDALARMRSESFDVVITDIRMPDMDGRALYREIEKHWPRRAHRVVFITGDTLAVGLREFAAENGCPIIEKPFLPSEVRRIVAAIADAA